MGFLLRGGIIRNKRHHAHIVLRQIAIALHVACTEAQEKTGAPDVLLAKRMPVGRTANAKLEGGPQRIAVGSSRHRAHTNIQMCRTLHLWCLSVVIAFNHNLVEVLQIGHLPPHGRRVRNADSL